MTDFPFPPAGVPSSQNHMIPAPPSSYWTPGSPCPVSHCSGSNTFFKMRSDFRRHWIEQHEESIEQYNCALCPLTSKRRSNLAKHIRMKHPDVDLMAGFGPVQYQTNKKFIDPYPLTLDLVLSGSSISYYSDTNGPVLHSVYSESKLTDPSKYVYNESKKYLNGNVKWYLTLQEL